MSNNQVAQRPTFSTMISTNAYQKTIANTLKDPDRAKRFCASIISAVSVNPALQECDPATILSGALLGESLNLSPSPQLGQYYLVPFDNRKKGCKDAQFILGYKGYIQLALRTGEYKHLNVIAVKEGELANWDPITEEATLSMIEDEEEREKKNTTGYLAMFEYLNGFRKTIYWSRSKMERHALQYSKGYAAKKGYTFWEKEFDSMAYKTMLRQLISKRGMMSVDMRQAVETDMAAELQDEEYLAPAENQPQRVEAPAEPQEVPQQTEAADPGEDQVSLDDL